MGSKALQFGALADLELLNQLLGECSELLSGLKGELSGAKVDIEARASRNKELRNRMMSQKKKMNKDMGSLITQMMSAMGQDPKDLLTEQQITLVLEETFNKFDADNSGILERPEFHKVLILINLERSIRMNLCLPFRQIEWLISPYLLS